MKVKYEEATKAKEILLEYLKERIFLNEFQSEREINLNHTEFLVYLALTQDYFLD